MRVLHFSDIHIPLRKGDVPFSGWFGKRALGLANLLLGRGKFYEDAEAKILALDTFRKKVGADLVLCTGDYTGLGSEAEIARARAAVGPLMEAPLGYVTVPGNHDLYVRDTWKQRRFEHHFRSVLSSDFPEATVDGGPWPLVRLVGDDVAVVAVNGAAPRPPWTASGRIPVAQLDALSRVLADDRIADRFVFVMTHYAARLEDDRPDVPGHRLRNDRAFLETVAAVPRGALLCGHVHHPYTTHIAGVRIPLFCAGSTTKDGRESLWVYDVDAASARATLGRWTGTAYELATAAPQRIC